MVMDRARAFPVGFEGCTVSEQVLARDAAERPIREAVFETPQHALILGDGLRSATPYTILFAVLALVVGLTGFAQLASFAA